MLFSSWNKPRSYLRTSPIQLKLGRNLVENIHKDFLHIFCISFWTMSSAFKWCYDIKLFKIATSCNGGWLIFEVSAFECYIYHRFADGGQQSLTLFWAVYALRGAWFESMIFWSWRKPLVPEQAASMMETTAHLNLWGVHAQVIKKFVMTPYIGCHFVQCALFSSRALSCVERRDTWLIYHWLSILLFYKEISMILLVNLSA